jgi:PAS domain S-box-containing protein
MTSEQDRAKLEQLLINELEDFAVFLVGLDGRIASWNPGVERFFGYKEADFIGRDFATIFTPEDRAAGAHEQEMENVRRTGRSSDIRWHLCKDQTRVFVEGVLVALRDDSGNCIAFAKVARAVNPSHTGGSLLGTILEGTDDAIYAVDREGRFTFANAPAAKLFGRDLNALIGHRRDEIVPAPLAGDLRATDQSVMESTGARLVEEKLPTDRGERVLLTTKAAWRDTEGKPIGVVSLAKDITAQNAHREDRERLLRDVRRSNEELAAFSHVVAHDLRAPLRGVKIYAEMLAQHLEGSDDTAKEFIRFITDGAAHMEQLIDSLLRYAESGEELALQRVNVNAVVDGLLRSLGPLIRTTGTTVTRDPLPEVDADPVRLLQVFQNLLVNAISYRGSDPPRIHIAAEKTHSDYCFRVTDNGEGIARDNFERIFAPLKRFAAKNIPGSGLGLALSRKIIELHGGRMWVESVLGKGSTFLFTLPIPESGRGKSRGRPPAS